MLLCPVTSAGVQRANSSLRYIKNVYRSTMTEDRFNVLFIHRDIKLDYDAIVHSEIMYPNSSNVLFCSRGFKYRSNKTWYKNAKLGEV